MNNGLFNDILDSHHLFNHVWYLFDNPNRILPSYFGLPYNKVTALNDQFFGNLLISGYSDIHIDGLSVSLDYLLAKNLVPAWYLDQPFDLCKNSFLNMTFHRFDSLYDYRFLFDNPNLIISWHLNNLSTSDSNFLYLLYCLISPPQRYFFLPIHLKRFVIVDYNLSSDLFGNLLCSKYLFLVNYLHFFYLRIAY